MTDIRINYQAVSIVLDQGCYTMINRRTTNSAIATSTKIDAERTYSTNSTESKTKYVLCKVFMKDGYAFTMCIFRYCIQCLSIQQDCIGIIVINIVKSEQAKWFLIMIINLF